MVQTNLHNSIESYQTTNNLDTIPSEQIVKMALAELNLYNYVQQAWHVVEPATIFQPGWHLEAICDHLQAVHENTIKNLIINIPPRCMKSLTVAVFFPTWLWLQEAALRFLYSSYAEELSTRDALKSRRLIQSMWYQSQWSHKFQLTGDQNQKTRYENNLTGYRISTSVGGLGTGEGGDYIIVDDPHNVKQTESDKVRQTTINWWFETMSTRVNNPKTAHKIIIMQRLHEGDLTGEVLAKELNYEHLMLPAEYDKERRCTTVIFEDPRTKESELLWDNMYDRKSLDELKDNLVSAYAVAGQLQQQPIKRGGQMFEIDKIEIIKDFPLNTVIKAVRYWDKAGTKAKDNPDACFTAGVLIYELIGKIFIVVDVVRGQWEAGTRERRIKQTAALDSSREIKNGVHVTHVYTWLEQEGGSGGKESAENTVKNLSGYRVKKETVTGDKVVRAEPFADQVEAGNVKVLDRDWTKDYLHELEFFPKGKFKDQVDSSSGSFNKIHGKKKKAGGWGSTN